MNIPSFKALFTSREKIVKTIQALCKEVKNLASGVQEAKTVVIAYQPMPEEWKEVDTMSDLIAAVNADETAVPGRLYLSTIRLNDLPYYNESGGGTSQLIQAEMRIEIMASENIMGSIKKVILFTITSTNSPYHWEYTSAWGNAGQWVSFVTN